MQEYKENNNSSYTFLLQLISFLTRIGFVKSLWEINISIKKTNACTFFGKIKKNYKI